ncbi:MAG: membrane protein insertase YidC [Ruminococcus sp.]|nr:membrane protein insertase YidC [Candidatus Apopatosoma intestinale]
MFNAIYSFLGKLLGIFSGWFGGNYLFGLLIFAILFKVILLPFGIKQQKTSIRQAHLRPREMAIRKKYAGRDDKPTQQKMQNEIMELYQQEGYNPMGGCLPMILQMVIILLLYQVIIYPLQHVVGVDKATVAALTSYMTDAENGGLGLTFVGRSYQEIQVIKEMIARGKDTILAGFGAYKDVTAAQVEAIGAAFDKGLPNFNLFGIQNFLAEVPSTLFKNFSGSTIFLALIPILNAVLQFFTMKITKKLTFQPMQADSQQQMGCSGKMMDYFFPAFTLYIAFVVPAAIGIYWLFNNVLGIAQTYILHKTMPLPVITEEEIKAAEREYNAKTAKKKLSEAKAKKSKYDDEDETYESAPYTESGEGPTRYDRED